MMSQIIYIYLFILLMIHITFKQEIKKNLGLTAELSAGNQTKALEEENPCRLTREILPTRCYSGLAKCSCLPLHNP